MDQSFLAARFTVIMSVLLDLACNVCSQDAHRLYSCVVNRTTEKFGFHRDLTTEVRITEAGLDITDQTQFLIQENVPAGMYLDLFELKSLVEFGGPEIFTENEFDIEAPEFLSTSHQVLVYGGYLKRHGSEYQGVISHPIHLRYHAPSDTEKYETVTLNAPEILIKLPAGSEITHKDGFRCSASTEELCQWKKLHCSFGPSKGMLQFSVPVGIKSQMAFIVIATLSVTLFGTYLLAKSVLSKNNPTGKQHKRK